MKLVDNNRKKLATAVERGWIKENWLVVIFLHILNSIFVQVVHAIF